MAISRAVRSAVARAARGGPSISEWAERVAAISPAAAEAVEGFYTGSEGRGSFEFEGRFIVVGWYAFRVEYSYVS